MGNEQAKNCNSKLEIETTESNIIINHNFSQGLSYWFPIGRCNCELVITSKTNSSYAIVKDRKIWWNGLGQDITTRVSVGCTYSVSAIVGISGTKFDGFSGVIATLKLEYKDSPTSFLHLGRTCVKKEWFEMLSGEFSLSTMPSRAVFYLEGPTPDFILLVQSVVIARNRPETSILNSSQPTDNPVKSADKIPETENPSHAVNTIQNINLSHCTLNVATGSPVIFL